MVKGLSLVGETGVVLGLVGPVGYPWWWSVLLVISTWRCFRARGVPPPLGEGVFFLFCGIHFGVGWVCLLSQERKKEKKSWNSFQIP